LNVIFGASNTDKSFIVEAFDYMSRLPIGAGIPETHSAPE
jgi:AAA15 family ATPase/GTPase